MMVQTEPEIPENENVFEPRSLKLPKQSNTLNNALLMPKTEPMPNFDLPQLKDKDWHESVLMNYIKSQTSTSLHKKGLID
jgi:hypothetical protein